MLPVYINGRFLTQRLSGVQRYAREIVCAMDELLDREAGGASTTNWTLLAPEGTSCDLPLRHISFRSAGATKGHLWEQATLPRLTRDGTLLSLGNSGPVSHARQVVVIHDVAVYRTPCNFGGVYGAVQRTVGRTLSRRAKIVTVSQFSRSELAEIFRLDPKAIDVVGNGAEHLDRVTPDATIVSRLNLTAKNYFLCVGSPSPNKNLGLALRAHRLLGRSDVELVVVGGGDPKVLKAKELAGAGVTMAGTLTDGEIAELYRRATALIFPSTYEGFGIPPLEAMSHGCPVLASAIRPVREVCGDAALYFASDAPGELAHHMARLLDDGATGSILGALGRKRAQQFSWTDSAEKLLTILLDVEQAR